MEYGCHVCYQYVTEGAYRNRCYYWPEESLDYWVMAEDREQGLLQDNVQLCGMEPFILNHMKVVEGDLSKLYGEGNYVAAVYYDVGDKVLVRYADEMEYYNPDTGEVYPNYESIRDDELYSTRPIGGQLVEYEVAAIIEWTSKLSYRYLILYLSLTLWPILTVAPIFVLPGVLIPLEAYRFMAWKSVVERLREAE